jgi:low temperature requirement protein LtrA
MTLILLNIRIHKSLREKLSNEAFKEMLFQEVGAILNLISSQEDKRIISFHLSKVVKQMLEERKNKG